MVIEFPTTLLSCKFNLECLQFQVICDLNVQIATFRDLLIHVGTAKDAPELREKIRRIRRQCVEACKQTHTTLLPQIKR